MAADVTFDPYDIPLAMDSTPILVYRFDTEAEGEARLQALPNVFCLRVQFEEGASYPVAYFEYTFDDTDPSSPYPSQFDDVWPLTAQGRWVVSNDDRLVVYGITSSGIRRIIFDGFAQIPQVNLSPNSQSVTFTAVGTPIRCWDTPIGGAFYRNADHPELSDPDEVVATDLPTRFNPDRQPNCVPTEGEIEGEDDGYPVFLDHRIRRDPDPRTYWTVGKAIRYLLAKWNSQEEPIYIKNWSFFGVDKLLQARKPKSGEFFDPGDPNTYTASDVVIRDYDATNKAWPDVLQDLCGYAGAAFKWILEQDENDEPMWRVRIYRKDAGATNPALDLLLDEPGGPLDPGANNLAELNLSRDSAALVNSFKIETNPIDVEVSIVLALGYEPAAGDESDANRKKYLLSALTAGTSSDRKKYREWVADEAGDGHWDYPTSMWLEEIALDLSAVLGEDDPETGPNYVKRLRPGERTLISKDSLGKARRAVLHISRDYAGECPAVWDGSGTWQPIPSGWEPLKDRFGIAVTVEDPEAWDIGKYSGADPQNPGRTLRAITSQANPSSTDPNTQRFYLMLTAVIESDLMLAARALPRQASPTRFIKERRLECRDHFRQQIVAANSWYNQTDEPINARDDTAKAEAHAEAQRSAQEFPPMVGQAVIPWLTNSYRIGDRLRMVAGRDVTFQANAGTDSGEAERYPFITGIDYDFTGDRQHTTLHYSDNATRPQGEGLRNA